MNQDLYICLLTIGGATVRTQVQELLPLFMLKSHMFKGMTTFYSIWMKFIVLFKWISLYRPLCAFHGKYNVSYSLLLGTWLSYDMHQINK